MFWDSQSLFGGDEHTVFSSNTIAAEGVFRYQCLTSNIPADLGNAGDLPPFSRIGHPEGPGLIRLIFNVLSNFYLDIGGDTTTADWLHADQLEPREAKRRKLDRVQDISHQPEGNLFLLSTQPRILTHSFIQTTTMMEMMTITIIATNVHLKRSFT